MSTETTQQKENPIGDYLLNEEIGSGGFAKVVQGIHIPTGEKVAVKIMDKAQIFSEPLNLNRIRREIAILKIVRHKNIIKLYELMETPHKIYLVMEYCNGGELFDYIVSKQHLTEKQACRFFQEIIDSLEYLHSLNIVHRDIKPENLLIDNTRKQITLKLIDFGISNCYNPDKLLTTPCGTASYAPPEMHKGEEYYGLLSDVWSAGVVLYAMVFGYLPFCEDDEDTNINNIIEGNYEIPEEASPELADLLVHLLDINPLTRYDLEQIKQHPWFNIVKPYVSYPGVIEGYHRIPIDMKIVDECVQFGYDRNKIIESVKKCKYNRNSAVYYIILSKMKREGYNSISDLFSDKYLNFINDPKNIIFENDDNGNENDYNEYNKMESEKENMRKNNSDKNLNRMTRHQSHPINDMNIKKELLSYDPRQSEKKPNNKKINEEKMSSPPADLHTENKIYQKPEIPLEINKVSTKKQQQTSCKSAYTKPKVRGKRNRIEKKNEDDIKQMTINENIQTNKHINANNYNTTVSTKKRNSQIEINKKPKINPNPNPNNNMNNKNVKNNYSFSQNRKNKDKKPKENNNKNNFPDFSNKKPEDNALKTEIIRKNLNQKRVMPINSFHILSKTKEILNSINDNESVNLDFMNTSFNKKLSDDIKENILKLKNPKKKIPGKEKKINNALLSLKMKKQKKKGMQNNYNYKRSNKNKSKKMNINAPIFKVSTRKDHTIIHNRNSSLIVEHRNNYHKNLNSENNRKRKDFSLSPNMSQERRNIINIYVQNKNNINSNNVYNINLITKNNNNYSIENSHSNRKKVNIHSNNSNIKVAKKIKNSRQKLKSIDDKYSNNNNYLNTSNINGSFSNRNRKYDFQTPNKLNQNLYFEKPSKVLTTSTVQYQSNTTTNNNEIFNSNLVTRGHRAQSQKFNTKGNKQVKKKRMYNNSFNDFYNKNKKKIRLSFKPIKENEIDNINISKKNLKTNMDINKINSNQKIKKINSSVKNSARVENNKYHRHYKSRSMMDIENPISLKNHPKTINKNKDNNNYLYTNNRSSINEEQKIIKIKSTRCASMKPIETTNNNYNSNYNINYSTKLSKKMVNMSFIAHRPNDNKQSLEPRKYKGPVDLKCILATNSLLLLIEKISSFLRKNKVTKVMISPYRLRCSKGGEIFDIEFLSLGDHYKKNNNKEINHEYMSYSETFYNNANDINFKTITESKSEKSPLLYYFTIISRGNIRNISKNISRLICAKFCGFKNKK